MVPNHPHPVDKVFFPTLVHALQARMELKDVGLTAIDDHGVERARSWGQIYVNAQRRATWMIDTLGVSAGMPVAIALPNGLRFVECLFATWFVGAVPVTLAQPGLFGSATLNRARHILADAQVVMLLAADEDLPEFTPLADITRVVSVPHEPPAVLPWKDALPTAEQTALLQYTSGSTTRPRGVVLTHGNLAANCRGFINQDTFNQHERTGGWLPLYHDMGLIAQLLGSIYMGIPCVLIGPSTFLMNPLSWLEILSRYRCTITYTPNFALAHVLRRVDKAARATLDLSSLRRFVVGGEPINAELIAQFQKDFTVAGLPRDVIIGAYGLAEATVCVSRSVQGIPTIEQLDREALTQGIARLATDEDTPSLHVVSVGPVIQHHQVRIVTEDRTASDRVIGEIWVQGPSIMAGYWKNPEATAEAIVEWKGERWLKTGDLGYLADGKLFICGRTKELIIIRGKNYHPHDVEVAAEQIDGMRAGQAVAFAVPASGGEVAVLVGESTAEHALHPAIKRAVRAAVIDQVGLKLHDIVLLPKGSTPKTTSGKRQRRLVRSLYLTQRS